MSTPSAHLGAFERMRGTVSFPFQPNWGSWNSEKILRTPGMEREVLCYPSKFARLCGGFLQGNGYVCLKRPVT